MGVCEQDRYPFLRQEMGLIEQALGKEMPVLGICPGSQLLAATLGAEVIRRLSLARRRIIYLTFGGSEVPSSLGGRACLERRNKK